MGRRDRRAILATRVARVATPLGIGRHASGIADSFNGHIDEFRISHIQHSDGWIETTCNNMSNSGAFAAAGQRSRKAEMTSRHRWPALGWSSA